MHGDGEARWANTWPWIIFAVLLLCCCLVALLLARNRQARERRDRARNCSTTAASYPSLTGESALAAAADADASMAALENTIAVHRLSITTQTVDVSIDTPREGKGEDQGEDAAWDATREATDAVEAMEGVHFVGERRVSMSWDAQGAQPPPPATQDQ